MLGRGLRHRGQYFAYQHICRISILFVSVALLIKLNEVLFVRKLGSNDVCLSANRAGCAPNTNFHELSPGDEGRAINVMNEYFCSVSKNLDEKIEYDHNPLRSGDYNVNPEEKCFGFNTIDLRNIKDAIGRIKTYKGFGTDNISSYFLKLAKPYIENSLAYIFNTSLKRSKFPDD